MPIVDRICEICHVEFRGRQKKDRVRRFCSLRCRDDGQRTKVTLRCVQCRQGFLRKAYQKDWSQQRGPFCSMPCYGAWQKENTGGSANPNWTAQSNARYAGQWERNRNAALVRADHRCVTCGDDYWLHVHHVIPWAVGQDDPHALDNLVTLCARHHRRVHMALARLAS